MRCRKSRCIKGLIYITRSQCWPLKWESCDIFSPPVPATLRLFVYFLFGRHETKIISNSIQKTSDNKNIKKTKKTKKKKGNVCVCVSVSVCVCVCVCVCV